MKKIAYVLIGLGVITMFTDLSSGLVFVVIGAVLYVYGKKKPNKVKEKSINTNEKPTTTLKPNNTPGETTRIRFNVMGLDYEDRHELLHYYVSKNTKLDKYGNRVLVEDDVIELKDEDNPHDPNAIAIYHTSMGKIGYVPKKTTARVRNFFKKDEPNTMRIRFSEQNEGEYIATVRIITVVKQVS